MRPGCSSRSPGSRAPGRREARDRPPVRTVTVNLVGVAPGVPRQLVLELDEGATVGGWGGGGGRRGGAGGAGAGGGGGPAAPPLGEEIDSARPRTAAPLALGR